MGGDEFVPAEGPDGDRAVMAAIDGSGDTTRFIIADVSRDESWLSIRKTEAPTLAEWR